MKSMSSAPAFFRVIVLLLLQASCDSSSARIEQSLPDFDEQRIVAIGDIHGDFDAAQQALNTAQLVDADGHWNGGAAVLVQLGDILDRGPDERALLDYFGVLASEAEAQGGEVIVLNGNHEIITVGAYYDYATEEACDGYSDLEGLDLSKVEFAELSPACQKRAAAFWPGGPYAEVLATHPVSVVLADTIFVHGGLFPSHVEYGLDRIDEETSAWMRGQSQEPPAPIRYTTNSMVWTRSFSEGPVAEVACEILESMLNDLSLKRMVVAHTVQPMINSDCGDRVWRIDTGMADYYGGPIQVLELRGGEINILQE